MFFNGLYWGYNQPMVSGLNCQYPGGLSPIRTAAGRVPSRHGGGQHGPKRARGRRASPVVRWRGRFQPGENDGKMMGNPWKIMGKMVEFGESHGEELLQDGETWLKIGMDYYGLVTNINGTSRIGDSPTRLMNHLRFLGWSKRSCEADCGCLTTEICKKKWLTVWISGY